MFLLLLLTVLVFTYFLLLRPSYLGLVFRRFCRCSCFQDFFALTYVMLVPYWAWFFLRRFWSSISVVIVPVLSLSLLAISLRRLFLFVSSLRIFASVSLSLLYFVVSGPLCFAVSSSQFHNFVIVVPFSAGSKTDSMLYLFSGWPAASQAHYVFC